MKCIKCDICGKYAKVWRETIFSFWGKNGMIEVKEICLDCVEVIESKIKEMALNAE